MLEVVIGLAMGVALVAGIVAFAFYRPAKHNRLPVAHHEDWSFGPPNDP